MVRKVLIADDERTIADTLATILKMHGFQTRATYDGQQAVETALLWQPHIFLTDVLMPRMDGIEAAMAICRILPECRVMLLSGLATGADLAGQVRSLGKDFEILQKPIRPEDLLAQLKAGRGGRWPVADGV